MSSFIAHGYIAVDCCVTFLQEMHSNIPISLDASEHQSMQEVGAYFLADFSLKNLAVGYIAFPSATLCLLFQY